MEHIIPRPCCFHTTWCDVLDSSTSPPHGGWFDPLPVDSCDSPDELIHSILDHRYDWATCDWQYLVHWLEHDAADATWEPRASLVDTAALDVYESSITSPLSAPTTVITSSPLGGGTDQSSSDALVSERCRLRERVFAGFRAAGISRRTRRAVYDVWSDGLVVGPSRCPRRERRGVCLACLHLRGRSCPETTRHVVWDCPDSMVFWDLVARALLLTLSSSDADARRAHAPAVEPLLLHMRLALLSGLATECLSVSSGEGLALRTMCHEALALLVSRRHAFSSECRPRTLSFSPYELYSRVRVIVERCATALYRDALEREALIRIRHPGWQPPESGRHPVGEWEREWVTSGMIGDDGRCNLPAAEQVPSSWASRSPPRVAVRLLAAMPVRVTLVTHCDLVSCPVPDDSPAFATFEPAAWVCYTDGSYTSHSPERAGWAFVVVCGGDGDADADAREVGHGYGPVVTDELAPTFVGAPRLTNNTGELSALVELLTWLESRLRSSPRPPFICVRPDSTYALNTALGLSRAGNNLEMAAHARRLWRAVSDLCGLRHSHVRGHSNHYWNDCADYLADLGASGEVGPQGGRWDLAPWPTPLRADVDRWVARCSWRAVARVTDDAVRLTLSLSYISVHFAAAGSILPYDACRSLAHLTRDLESAVTHPPAPDSNFVACTTPLLILLRPSVVHASDASIAALSLASGVTHDFVVPLRARGLQLRRLIRPALSVLLRHAQVLGGHGAASADPSSDSSSDSLGSSSGRSSSVSSGDSSGAPSSSDSSSSSSSSSTSTYSPSRALPSRSPSPSSLSPPPTPRPTSPSPPSPVPAALPPPCSPPWLAAFTAAARAAVDAAAAAAPPDALHAAAAAAAAVSAAYARRVLPLRDIAFAHMLDQVNLAAERYPGDNPCNDDLIRRGLARVSGFDARGAETIVPVFDPATPRPVARRPSPPRLPPLTYTPPRLVPSPLVELLPLPVAPCAAPSPSPVLPLLPRTSTPRFPRLHHAARACLSIAHSALSAIGVVPVGRLAPSMGESGRLPSPPPLTPRQSK